MKVRANAAYIDEAISNILNAGPLFGRDDLLPECKRLYTQARKLKYKKGIGATGRVIARILMSSVRYGEAKPYLDESIKMLSLLKERDDLYFSVMLLKSEMEAAAGNHDAALKITTGLVADYKDKMSLERYAGFCLNTGTIYFAQGLLFHALYHYQKIISRKDEFRHLPPFNGIWMSYANVLKDLQLYDQSLEEHLIILEEVNPANHWHRFQVNMNIANLYAGHFQDFDNSKKHMDECFRIADPEVYPVLYTTAMSNLGVNLMAAGKYAEALSLLTDNRVFELVSGSRAEQAKLNVNITNCLLKTGKVKDAEKYLEQAEDLLSTGGMAQQKAVHYSNRILYYSLIKNHAEATRYIGLYQGALDENHRIQNKLQAQQLNALLSLERRERELEAEKLRNVQAQREVEFAHQQNAMMQANIEQRNTLIDEFQKAIKKMESTDARRKEIFKEMHEKISAVRRSNIEMAAYDTKFNTAHHEQVRKLQARSPGITSNEAKIAVMLASGLGNKEIAGLTLTTTRNIETHRLKLRKKMGLKREDDLLTMIRKVVV